MSLARQLAFTSLILLAAASTGSVDACNFDRRNNYGDMTGDSFVHRGSDFTIACNLHKQSATIGDRTYSVDSSMIRFKFSNTLVPPERVTIVNETAAAINIARTDFADSGLYFCFLHVPEAVQDMTLVCASKLTVGCE